MAYVHQHSLRANYSLFGISSHLWVVRLNTLPAVYLVGYDTVNLDVALLWCGRGTRKHALGHARSDLPRNIPLEHLLDILSVSLHLSSPLK